MKCGLDRAGASPHPSIDHPMDLALTLPERKCRDKSLADFQIRFTYAAPSDIQPLDSLPRDLCETERQAAGSNDMKNVMVVHIALFWLWGVVPGCAPTKIV